MALRIEDVYEPTQLLPYLELGKRPVNVATDNLVRTAADAAEELAGKGAELEKTERRLVTRAKDNYERAVTSLRRFPRYKEDLASQSPASQIRKTERAVMNFGETDAGEDNVEGARHEPTLYADMPPAGEWGNRVRTQLREDADTIGRAIPRE